MSSFNPGATQLPMAAVALRVRQIRNQVFNSELFSDPAWDILLWLRQKGPQAADALAAHLGLGLPIVTRWVDILMAQKLVESGETQAIRLTAPTTQQLDAIFDSAVSGPETERSSLSNSLFR